MKYYALRYSNGSLVGIDYGSGGYPWEAWKATDPTIGMSQVKMWQYNPKGKNDALEYSHNEFELVVLEVNILSLNIAEGA